MRPKRPEPTKGITDIVELVVTFAPDVSIDYNGRCYDYHANKQTFSGDSNCVYRIIQIYYYNAVPVRFITMSREYQKEVWVEILDRPLEPVRVLLDKAGAERVAKAQHKYHLNDYNKHEYFFHIRATPYAGQGLRGPSIAVELLEHMPNAPLINCIDAPDAVALVGIDSPWYPHRQKIRTLLYDVIPALGCAPTKEMYRKVFKEEMSIKKEITFERLYESRQEMGLP